jgi:hypothetical protein
MNLFEFADKDRRSVYEVASAAPVPPRSIRSGRLERALQ